MRGVCLTTTAENAALEPGNKQSSNPDTKYCYRSTSSG